MIKLASPTHQQDQPVRESLIAFESGHYKTVNGRWKGDSVWCHFQKPDGGMVHVNKDKVEYIESFPAKPNHPTISGGAISSKETAVDQD